MKTLVYADNSIRVLWFGLDKIKGEKEWVLDTDQIKLKTLVYADNSIRVLRFSKGDEKQGGYSHKIKQKGLLSQFEKWIREREVF